MDSQGSPSNGGTEPHSHSNQLASIEETPSTLSAPVAENVATSSPSPQTAANITDAPSTRRRPVSLDSIEASAPRRPVASENSPTIPLPSQSSPQTPLAPSTSPSRQTPTPYSQTSRGSASPSRPPVSSRPTLRGHRQPSIRIRRFVQDHVPGTTASSPYTTPTPRDEEAGILWGSGPPVTGSSRQESGRRRSSSDPSRGQLPGSSSLRTVRTSTGPVSGTMPSVREESHGQTGRTNSMPESDIVDFDPSVAGSGAGSPQEFGNEYREDLVDVLDTIDPEVSTLTTLTNLQNSMFLPNLGRFLSRRPVYTLTQTPTYQSTRAKTNAAQPPPQTEPTIPETAADTETATRPQLTHTDTITSTLSESRYAVLPHGRSLEGWTPAEKDELNDHVRHMLHSRRSRFKRGMKGFGQYISKPLGFFITLYATLITLFGLAWVLFLIGWVNVGGKQLYIINVIDNVLVALFAIMGDGLAPFRAWDTYNMIFIAHYHHLSWKLRRKARLPKLENKNDLPELREEEVGTEEKKEGDFVVLSDKQQASLTKHQDRFSRSHTFYKPHETGTHFAFPIAYLIAIVTLLDCHSLLQISLGSVTWSIDYKKRPFALTTVILCCSITCNITAGVLISIGDHRTRKKDVLERMDRQELTSVAIEKVERHREERKKEEAEADSEDPEEAVKDLPPKVEDTKASDAPEKSGAPSSVDSPNNRWTALLTLKKVRDRRAGREPRGDHHEMARHRPITAEEEEAGKTAAGLGGAAGGADVAKTSDVHGPSEEKKHEMEAEANGKTKNNDSAAGREDVASGSAA